MSQLCRNGHPIASKARFCRECGAPAAAASEKSGGTTTEPLPGSGLPGLSDTTVVVPQIDQEPSASPRRRAHGPIILAVTAGVVVLLGVGAAGALLLAGSGSDTPAVRTAPPSKIVVSTTSSLDPVTTTVPVVAAPPVPAAARYCVRDDTPLNLHATPGVHADVIGLIMVSNCEATDPASGPQVRSTSDGGSFRRVVWRGLDGWLAVSAIGSNPRAVPQFNASTDPSCSTSALLEAWTAAERWDYTEDPEYQPLAAECTGTESGDIAFGRFARGKLNPDGRMTEAIFRNTGTGWQELAHSGPTLLEADLASTGVSTATLDALRAAGL